jgi:hypothetical protein
MGIFVQDSFADTAATNLTSHTGEVGATWTEHPNYTAGGAAISDANRCRKLTGTSQTSAHYASGTPAGVDYEVEADLVFLSSQSMSIGVAARIDTGANTMYFARWLNASTRWELFKLVTGTATSLGTFSDTFSSGTKNLRLQCYDAAKKVFVDDVERISSADNAITAAGSAGLRDGSTIAGGDTTGFHWDNFLATEADAFVGDHDGVWYLCTQEIS